MGLSAWWLCRRLWRRELYLWQPAVPPVDVGSSHWQHLSVLVLIPYEYWSSLFRLMLLRNKVHWGRAVGVTTCCRLWHRGLSLWQPAVPPVYTGSSRWQLLPVLMPVSHKHTCWVFDKYTRIDILAHWPWDQMADIFKQISAYCRLFPVIQIEKCQCGRFWLGAV